MPGANRPRPLRLVRTGLVATLARAVPVIFVILAARMTSAQTRPGQLPKEKAMSFFDLSSDSIDHVPTPLSRWKGKVALIVNTASECGNTPQYAGLEKLWEEYQNRGFVLLGFPSNDFGGQEPGGEADIKKFCSLKYRVTFPMFAKIKTKGDGQSPVYTFLTAHHGVPKWNFHKYLVGKDGQVIREFAAQVQPDAPELRTAIDAALVQ
jgi:glutathione peroxidase